MGIDKTELKILIGIVIGITLWFTFGINYFYNISSNNSSLFYLLFLIGYILLINRFVFSEPFTFKKIFSLFVVILVSSILLPPYLLTINSPPELSTNLRFSGDVFIYSLLPLTWNHTIKYFLVYIIIPLILLALLAYINDRNKFVGFLKNGSA